MSVGVLLLLLHRGGADVGGVSGPVRDPSGTPAQQLFLTIWATRPNKPQPATTKGNLCSQSLRLGVTYWRSNLRLPAIQEDRGSDGRNRQCRPAALHQHESIEGFVRNA
jgi:hypothetical protein